MSKKKKHKVRRVAQQRITVSSQYDFAIETFKDGVTITGVRYPIKRYKIVAIVIPETIDGISVVAIGKMAFVGCVSLTSIKLPPLIRRIESCAFYGCKRLNPFQLPSKLQFIGKDALVDCPLCKSMKIPDSITCAPEGIFYRTVHSKTVHCRTIFCRTIHKKTTSLSSSKKVTSKMGIWRYPLHTEVSPDDFTTEQCRDGVIVTGLGNTVDKRNVLSINVPEMIDGQAVIVIGENAFRCCRSLVSVELPRFIRRIESHAFYGCKNLKPFHLPDGLQDIGSGAFIDCALCKSMKIPDRIIRSPESIFDRPASPKQKKDI